MAPRLLPKRKTADESFDVPGLDLGPRDLPTKDNQPFQTVLFAPAYCPKDSSRQLKYRLNVAIILRAFDYFYEFRNIDDFWSRVRYAVHKLWKPAHVQEIAHRYVAARGRYLKRTNGRTDTAQGIDQIIVSIADKLITNQTGAISQVNFPPSGFEGRAQRWAVEVGDLYALLGPYGNLSFPSEVSPLPQRQHISSSPQHSAFSQPLKSEVSENDDYSTSGDWRSAFNQDVLPAFKREHTTAQIGLDAPSLSESDLPAKPVFAAREDNPSAVSQSTLPAKPRLSAQPSALTPAEYDNQQGISSTPDWASAITSEVRQFSILGATNNAINGDATSTASKRPAASDEATRDPKRRAISPTKQVLICQSLNDSINKEMPATANEPRPSSSKATLSIDTTYRPSAASPQTPGPASALVKSSGTYKPILPGDASPTQPPGLASEAEIRRLQSAWSDKDQHIEQLQKTIVIMVESIKTVEERATREHEEVVRLGKEKSDLAARLQAAEEKIAGMSAAPPPLSPPYALHKDAMGPKPQDNTLEKARCEQFLSHRDYKGLLGHVSAETTTLAGPLFQALKREEGNESSVQWQALEAGWIALDWAKEQLKNNANKL